MATSDTKLFSWPVIKALYEEALQAEARDQERSGLHPNSPDERADNHPVWLSQPVDLRRADINPHQLPIGRSAHNVYQPHPDAETDETSRAMADIAKAIAQSRVDQQNADAPTQEAADNHSDDPDIAAPHKKSLSDDEGAHFSSESGLISEIEHAFSRFIQRQIKAEFKNYVSKNRIDDQDMARSDHAR